MMLHYDTVNPTLVKILHDIMDCPLFDSFRLVGGTSLSLRLGHRKSVDIDLFTDTPYGSLDYSAFETFFQNRYPYCVCLDTTNIVSFGRSYYVGNSEMDCVKVDLYYHEGMISPFDELDGIRICNLDDVVAMKIDVISRGGRKKDFWDIHELLNTYPMEKMLELHQMRYEYTHNRNQILSCLEDFTSADEDIDPICMKGKIWELIKLDIFNELENIR
jgi:hypothetical protein